MREQDITVPVAGATAGAVLVTGDRPRPGVLFLTDIRGIRAAKRGMARRIAEAGYTVLMPNVFFRSGKPPVFDPSLEPGSDAWKRRFMELTSPLTTAVMEADGGGYVDCLAGLDGVSAGPVGVVGYCFTGAMALMTAAARPAAVAAAASFHGGRLWTDSSASPHLALPRVKAELLIGHAEGDASMPAEAITKLDAALAAWGGRYESEVHEGARHGWTVPDGKAFHPAQADRAFGKLTAMLDRALSTA